jgi:hypothetical protein
MRDGALPNREETAMCEPKLYERYDHSEAIAAFGPEAKARSLCDGQWVIFPHVVIGFAEIGEPPKHSHFTNGGEFCWVANKPYRVSDDEQLHFVPSEVTSRHADRPIRLFVRQLDSEQWRYVGELAPACRFTISGKDNCGEAYFGLSPALSSKVWAEIGGFRPGDQDHDAIDAALDRLRQPVNMEERLWVLRRLVEYWHGPIRAEDGFIEKELEGFAIPYPLRWWYRWAGRRRKILSGQNTLLSPDELLVRDNRLVFYGENQWCYEWATLFKGDDPPVFGRSETTDPWQPEGIVLSEHLILACLFEAIICHSPYGATVSWLPEAVLDRIVQHIPPIAVNPWGWCGSTRFYAKGGAFMNTMPNGKINGEQGYSVWIGAKTEQPLGFLKPHIDKGWEYVAV